jgi:hypothetical protein
MDDRMQKRLEQMSEEQREVLRGFLRGFDKQVEMKTEQLLYELQDPERLSEEALEMRTRLLDGYVPLVDDDGELIYRRRDSLSLEDTRRFGAFMDSERRRYEREIGEIGESSEN